MIAVITPKWTKPGWPTLTCVICGARYRRQVRADRISLYCTINCKAIGLSHLRARITAENVFDHCDKSGGCWPWLGVRTPLGYGRLTIAGGPTVLAHRFAYQVATGIDPGELGVLHRCDNPPCIRPGHLFLGTQADNMADMVAKGRGIRGERAHGAKLTADQVLAIRADNRNQRVIGAEYGVRRDTISHIKNRVTWRHI